MWRVTALGYDTGSEYIYEVDAPADTKVMVVAASAFRQHGELKVRGDVSEYLRAHPRVEHIGPKPARKYESE